MKSKPHVQSTSFPFPRPSPTPSPSCIDHPKSEWPQRHSIIAVLPHCLTSPSCILRKCKSNDCLLQLTCHNLPKILDSPEPRKKICRIPKSCLTNTPIPYKNTSLPEGANTEAQAGTSQKEPCIPAKRRQGRSLQRTLVLPQRSASEAPRSSPSRIYNNIQYSPDSSNFPEPGTSGYHYTRPRSLSLDYRKIHPLYPPPPLPVLYDPTHCSHPRTVDWESLSEDSDCIGRYSPKQTTFEDYTEYPPDTGQAYKSEPHDINVLPEHQGIRHGSTNRNNRHRHPTKMNAVEEHERKVIIEFCHLLEKSKQLFNSLRELPQYGHKQWQSYFGRTFDVYTKLWKFQQQHRNILDTKYGLKRWQIGEIASKIGQLYYHFYLRTSETGYLIEAFSFYSAIRGRSYYTQACKEDKCELMVKKLRYYARYIVVCLLLKKLNLVRDLIKELDRQIIEYGNTYDPDDQIEWTVVMDEVKAFIIAESVVTVLHPENYPIILSHRLNILTVPPPERPTATSIMLLEAVIVGSVTQQVKFSELTIDMFRLLQAVEWEPTGEMPHIYNESPRPRFSSIQRSKGYNPEHSGRRENPHKYLLYKPSAAQVLVYLASGCYDLPPNGALLFYISADSLIMPASKHTEEGGYDVGGLATNVKSDLYREREAREKERDRERERDREHSRERKTNQPKIKEPQCIYPGDLCPFTRSPLFVIVDSDNSIVFQNIPRHFRQPLVVLMSPLDLPSSFPRDHRKEGSLFTLFLHSPLSAFCYCCDIKTTSLIQWERAQAYIEAFLIEASQIMMRHRVDPSYIAFMADDFLRLLVLRYLFCEVALRLHRDFRSKSHLPRSSPSLPEDLLGHPALVHIIMDLAAHLQAHCYFQDGSGAPSGRD